LGEIEISKGIVGISGDVIADSLGNGTSWEQYYYLWDLIIEYYSKLRNELSNKYFKMPYDKLPVEEKEAILEIGWLVIWVTF
jgi:hypothetical protein